MTKKLSEDYIKFTLSLSTSEAQQEIRKLEKASENLKNENKQLQKEMIKLTSEGKRNSREYQNLRAQLRANTRELSENKSKMNQLASTLDTTTKTYAQLRKEYGTLKRQMEHIPKALQPEEYERLQRQLNETAEAMNRLKVAATAPASDEGNSWFGKLKGKLRNGWQNIKMGGWYALGAEGVEILKSFQNQAREFVAQGIEMATSADGVLRAFRQLDSPGLLQNLRRATKNTVNDLQLMQAAVKARDFRIPLEDMGKYLAFAQLKAQQTGQSVDYMTDSIVTGLGRKSVLILDNLGLSAAEINEEVERTGDFMKGVATIVDRQLAQAGEYVSAKDKATQADVRLQNAQLRLGEKLAWVGNLWNGTKNAMAATLELFLPMNKAEQAYIRRKEELTRREEQHRDRLKELIAVMQDEYASSFRRLDAMKAIEKEYPALFQKYIDEKGHITDLIGLWKTYNEQRQQEKVERNRGSLEEIDRRLGFWRREEASAKNNPNLHGSKNRERYAREQIEKLEEERRMVYADVRADQMKQWQLDLKKQTDAQIKAELEEMKRLQSVYKHNKRQTLNVSLGTWKGSTTGKEVDERIALLEGEQASRTPKKEIRNKAYWEQRKKEAEDARNALDEQEKNSARWNELTAQIEEAKAKIEEVWGGGKKSATPTTTPSGGGKATVPPAISPLTPEEAQAAEEERWQQEEEAEERYLKRYGTLMQRREAIQGEYARRMEAATTEGDRMMLQKQMEEALGALDMEKLKDEINWELVFGDLGKASKQSLEDAKKQLKAFRESPEYKAMSVDQKKVVDESLDKIQSALVDNGGLLGGLPDQLQALKAAQDELTLAQEEYNKAMREGTDAEKEAATKKKNAAEKKKQNAEVTVEKSADKAVKNVSTLAGVISELGTNSEMSLSQVGQLGLQIADVFTEVSGKVGGMVGAILSVLDGVNKQGFEGFMHNVFGSVLNAAGSTWNTLTFGATSKIFGTGESDPQLAHDIERLTLSNQELKNSIDRLAEKMEDSPVAEATDIYEEQKRRMEESMANVQEMMRREGDAYKKGVRGKHSSDYYVDKNMSEAEWKRISDIVGQSVTHAGDFWALTSEQMAKVRDEATDLYAKIKLHANDGYRDAAQYMDEYADYYKQLQELEAAYRERLTSTSFDEVRNGFRDMLLDMEADTEDFAQSFEKMMQRAIIESMVSKTYADRLKKWYEDFGKAMASEGTVDKDEQDDLRREWDKIVQDALQERNELMASMGWDASAAQQQEASAKGFQSMSQDTGDELNGRFTALQESGIRIEAVLGLIGQTVQQAYVNGTHLLECSTEIRDILHECNDHLGRIEKHTALLPRLTEATEKSEQHLNDKL